MKNEEKFLRCIAWFLTRIRQESLMSIKLLCMESHVSTRTYAKVVKHIPVKPECYYRLFMGAVRTSAPEDFAAEWNALGTNLQQIK